MTGAATARHRAREVLFRIVYQADVTGDSLARVWEERRAAERLSSDQEQKIDGIAQTFRDAVRDYAQKAREQGDDLDRLFP